MTANMFALTGRLALVTGSSWESATRSHAVSAMRAPRIVLNGRDPARVAAAPQP